MNFTKEVFSFSVVVTEHQINKKRADYLLFISSYLGIFYILCSSLLNKTTLFLPVFFA